MAKLIPIDEMDVLKSASEVKTVADAALQLQDEASAAHLINEAANTGQHMALWRRPMSDALKQTLEGQGYKVTRRAAGEGTAELWNITGF